MKSTFFTLLMIIIPFCTIVQGALVSVVPTGANSYNIEGSSMDGVAGIQIDIKYDSSSTSKPVIAGGALIGNAMFAANTNVAGNIKVAIISTQPFSGSGIIATITNMGKIISSPSITMINSQGGTIDSSVAPANSIEQTAINSDSSSNSPASTTASTTSASTTSTSTTSTSTPTSSTGYSTSTTNTPVALGTVTMPTDPVSKPEPKSAEQQIEPSIEPIPNTSKEEPEGLETTTKKDAPEKEIEIKQTTYSSILERFKEYKGEMTPAILTALFSKEVANGIKQEPLLSISNGKEHIKVLFTADANIKVAPNFALTGAKMISLGKDETSGAWVLEALPEKGAIKATVTMLTNSAVIEYPLTIVPPAREITEKETDFALFLKDSGAKPAKRDLNGDGIHDYQDNYIYTAYYLMLQKNKGTKKSDNDVKKTTVKKQGRKQL